MKSLAVDPITAVKATVAGVMGAAAAEATAPWLLVLFVGLFAAWLSAGFSRTRSTREGMRIIARHGFTAVVVTLPALIIAGHYIPSISKVLPWLLIPVATFCGFVGPEWFVYIGKRLLRARVVGAKDDVP